MPTLYCSYPIKEEYVDEMINFYNSKEGFEFTKKQNGFISCEWFIAKNMQGKDCFYSWQQWQKKSDYHFYMALPERSDGSWFMTILSSGLDGDFVEIWGDGKTV